VSPYRPRRARLDTAVWVVYDCTQLMDFEWDAQKARMNARKHSIQFADAVHVLEDDNALTTSEHASDGEERWITLGVDALGRILVVVYTWGRQE
jgi:uncharacterized DUF497 family protein